MISAGSMVTSVLKKAGSARRPAGSRTSTIADAILDRLAHNAYRIELQGESLRKTRTGNPIAPQA
jgi:DNA replication protein DnaC